MTKKSNEEKFNELKSRYVKNFKRTNNKKVTVVYENGFVVIESDLGSWKVRISEFEKMLINIENRPNYSPAKPYAKEIFEQFILPINVDKEDDGQALIATIDNTPEEESGEAGLFVRLQSWDSKKEHTDFNKFFGRKIRVTIETID